MYESTALVTQPTFAFGQCDIASLQCMEMTSARAGSAVWAVGAGVRRVGLHA